MWTYASTYSKAAAAGDTWSIYDSENHDAQAESFYYLAAQVFSHRSDYRTRKYLDVSTVAQQLKAWHDHWSNLFAERAKGGLFIGDGCPRTKATRSARSSTSTTSPRIRSCGRRPA
jgi:hypothetical protein